MYNAHRGMAPGPQPGSRLTELLEQVRAEFDAQVGRSAEHEHQRKSRRLRMFYCDARMANGVMAHRAQGYLIERRRLQCM